jgi:hypothetical protein
MVCGFIRRKQDREQLLNLPVHIEGTTSYFVSQTVGGCESARAEIKVTINKTNPPAVENLSYCLNVTASTLTATGTALKWYAAASGGTGSASAPTPTTNAIGTKSYYVTQTLNGCESARAEIKVSIKNLSALAYGYCDH